MAGAPARDTEQFRSWIERELRAAFDPQELQVQDESHRHRGHAGAAGGGGHYRVTIVAEAFRGQTRLQRQRAVYAAVDAEMGAGIHALSVHARAPGEG